MWRHHLSRTTAALLAVLAVPVLAPAGSGRPPAAGAPPGGPPPPRDLVLRNALVVDGRDRVPFRGDVLVAGDRIALVAPAGSIAAEAGTEVLDLDGLALAPGFIDIHNHSTEGLLQAPAAVPLIAQGITTVVVGADGSSPWPLSAYLGRLEAARPAVNVAAMVGHGTVRRQVMGGRYRRAASRAEVAAMAARVRRAMEEGAFGLSTGLEYDPGFYATTEELVALARVAARYGGFYMTHIRDEEEGVMEAIEEAIEIGRRADLPVQISHIKMGNASVWGRAGEALARLRRANATGVDASADWYPYTAWASSLSVVVRSRRFTDPEEVAAGLEALGGAGRLQITRYRPEPSVEDLRLDEIASRWGLTPVEAYIRMMRNGGAQVIGHTMSEADVDAFAASPLVMVASDGGIGSAHPRGAGAFPRVLGRYVRERGVLRLERAIHKMTRMPARRLGLPDRGRIEAGAIADLVAFDPAAVVDRSTFEEPGLLPQGIVRVWVAGEPVWADGAPTGARPGRVLRRP